MIDISFLNQIRKFDLVLKKKVLSQYSGERQSAMLGQGLVFSDYREYIPGDDFRLIDWNVYARTDKFFIKRFEEEKNMTIHILIDASSSMNFGANITKFEYAAMLGLGFAYLAISTNEKFDISLFADTMEIIRPKKGENALIEILDRLNKKKIDGKSHFYDSLMSFKKRLKTRSMVIIISDFLFDPSEFEKSLMMFKRSEVSVLQVLDPEERRFTIAGDLLLKDSEQGHTLRTFISHRLRGMYKEKLEGHIAEINKLCKQVNARFFTINTNTPIFDTFSAVLRR
jgi:uncharacterized protein (DUF58 family)